MFSLFFSNVDAIVGKELSVPVHEAALTEVTVRDIWCLKMAMGQHMMEHLLMTK